MANNRYQGLGSGNWRTDFGKLGLEAQKKSLKGTYAYVVQTTREYKDVTEADIELRAKYGKSLISNYTSTDKKLIKLNKKITSNTLTMLNEVYYVYLGGQAYGKLSISVQRTPRGRKMTFILTKKART